MVSRSTGVNSRGSRGGGLVTRRRLLAGTAGALGTIVGARFALPVLSRAKAPTPVAQLSERAQALVTESFRGVDASRIWDVHVHLVGLGTEGTGCACSEEMQSHLNPLGRLRFDMFFAASGIRDLSHADAEYVEQLGGLAHYANPDGKHLLMAFDAYVREDGTEDRALSTFFVPNEYAARIAKTRPNFGFIASVHPYRADAEARLRAAARDGAVGVKWLPNSMGIDPASPRCDAFYRLLVELDLVLITHTGTEQAVHADDAQELGNPLRLRGALDRGVRVVAAHCATLGMHQDLDAVGHPDAPSFDLFLRMLSDGAHRGRLFGDISAVVVRNRERRPLHTLLTSSDLHPFLLYGSDYPVIAVNPIVSLNQLAWRELLDENDIEPLRDIFAANSLLFDFVLKRRLRVQDRTGDHRFSREVFETRRVFRKV